MMTEFGAEIAVNGNRPDWLKDSDGAICTCHEGPIALIDNSTSWGMFGPTAIKLPADHPYYRATEAGYKYWPGGDKAPDDWNGGTVLLRDGRMICYLGMSWSHFGGTVGNGDIIGYQQSKGPAIRLEGSAPPYTPPAAGRYLSPGEVDELVRAVQGGDIIAAQALIDPVVLRARELCNNRGFSFDGISEDIRDVIIAALRESHRPPEEKLRTIVRNVVYTARVEGGHFTGWTTADILSGKYDNTDLFKQMMKAAYNAI